MILLPLSLAGAQMQRVPESLVQNLLECLGCRVKAQGCSEGTSVEIIYVGQPQVLSTARTRSQSPFNQSERF